jgi:hypothetical protein
MTEGEFKAEEDCKCDKFGDWRDDFSCKCGSWERNNLNYDNTFKEAPKDQQYVTKDILIDKANEFISFDGNLDFWLRSSLRWRSIHKDLAYIFKC